MDTTRAILIALAKLYNVSAEDLLKSVEKPSDIQQNKN